MPDPPRRNDPCPCGSRRKFKHCHMQAEAAEAHRQRRLDEQRFYQARVALLDAFPTTPADFIPTQETTP